MEIHSFLGPFPHSPVDVLKNTKMAEFRICFGAQNLNEKQRSIISKQNTFPYYFKPIAMSSLTKYLQANDGDYFTENEDSGRGCEIFFDAGFWMAIIA